MERFELSNREIAKLNQGLRDIEDIMIDLERAKKAGVPNTDDIGVACQKCKERIVKLKSVYVEGQ